MTDNDKNASGATSSGRLFSLLILLFIGSGCSALIYEVVWYQLLGLVIGVSSASLGILLGTFMGGMCLGSLLLPRFASAARHPLRVYALLELGIGAFGLVILAVMPLVGSVYFGVATAGVRGLVLRGVIAAICLLPPTMLMGATLPAIARFVRSTPTGMSWLGFFYGGNIAGAVLGVVIAAFYLLRVFDVAVATYVAVAINLAVVAVALAVARRLDYRGQAVEAAAPVRPAARLIYVAVALSGLTALASEVLWTRHLSLFIGATVYGFALILAVFLFGLGIGTASGSTLARRFRSPGVALAGCQGLLCLATLWAAYAITQAVPFWAVTDGTSPWSRTGTDLARTAYAMLPAAVLWGASFPLALAAAASGRQDSGRLVGGLYAANTLGAIIGALSAGFFLVPWIGSQATQQLLIGLAALSALAVIVSLWSTGSSRPKHAIAVASVVAAGFLAMTAVPPVLGRVVAWGRYLPGSSQAPEPIYVGEGLTASIAVTVTDGFVLNYHNSGKVQASAYPQDMRLQRMLGHLTTLVPERQDSFLVIGLGAGVTAGAVSIEPALGQMTIAEIEPLVPEVVSEYFGSENFDVVGNPKVQIRVDDGRHFLQTTAQTFDGITSDPLDPWVKGSAALYTSEFWELAKSRLNPGGVVTVFVQLYETTEDAVQSEIATFFEAFPNGAVFANTYGGGGYDLILLGMNGDGRIDVSRMVERFADPAYSQVRESLSQVGVYSITDLLGTFAGTRASLAGWLEGAEINRDRNMRLQYLAGLGLNFYRQHEIFDAMVRTGVRYPDALFAGSDDQLAELERRITSQQGRSL
jgi:spermidine synthase